MIDTLLRYAAFTDRPDGGNPAGIVLDAGGLDDARMQAIAAEVGYSETVFMRDRDDGAFEARYFSPQAEVPFCGHATIAGAVALAERRGPGTLVLHTRAGRVTVETRRQGPALTATLTSVAPRVDARLPDGLLDAALAQLRWTREELDPALPARVAHAGAHHLILAAATRERLARLDYDFDGLKALMLAHGLTTLALVWRESATRYHARNPFPVGGVVEDPATGAAAAAFGAYLRELGLVAPPARITVLQGQDMGRPSHLTVDIGPAGPIRVGGQAVRLA